MADEIWPPSFTLDQERILNLLTGDRFYSNPSAALREAVLNAIDAVHRRRKKVPEIAPLITVIFNRDDLTLSVADNGIGMTQNEVSNLFTKVGASAATIEANKDSVGEFGIGVISYFMAGDAFELQTKGEATDPIGLTFSRQMLAGGGATEISPTQRSQGTAVTIKLRDVATFDLLLKSFPHWCRDVEGLSAKLLPIDEALFQGGSHRPNNMVEVENATWVERAHLGPVAEPTGWDGMTGVSTVAVLYRGVFVQEFEVKGAWGIEGSIDVDPKHFKPRLNREGFVEGQFQSEVEGFLRAIHPKILEAMASRLAEAIANRALDKWTEKRWASLWLSVPRTTPYEATVKAWDTVFRTLPAFELAVGNKWEAVSLERLMALKGEVFLAPLPDEKSNDVVMAALRFLRNTRRTVIRGVRWDKAWMRYATATYGTTADLISAVFSKDLPQLIPINQKAEQILSEISRTAPLFTGPPHVDLARLGSESPPALRLKHRLIINTDHPGGAAIVSDALRENGGQTSLIAIAARHAYEQLTQVAAAVRETSTEPEVLSPIRRRYIRSHLS
jgi:hypothetical protein